jgi:hypothetical protein
MKALLAKVTNRTKKFEEKISIDGNFIKNKLL